MANTNAEVVRPPDRADWMSCDHGHWEMRELCAVCAEASVIAYASTAESNLAREILKMIESFAFSIVDRKYIDQHLRVLFTRLNVKID